MKKNVLGLNWAYVQQVQLGLNQLLSHYQVHYQNLRGFHWNIRGKNFFDLHLQFEVWYSDAQVKIDTIAERILTLGGTPLHTFDDYLAHNNIEVAQNMQQDEQSLTLVGKALQQLLALERHIKQLADEAQDEGTSALMSDYIREQEKHLWMIGAWLG